MGRKEGGKRTKGRKGGMEGKREDGQMDRFGALQQHDETGLKLESLVHSILIRET